MLGDAGDGDTGQWCGLRAVFALQAHMAFVAHEGLAAARLQDFLRDVVHFRVESDGPAHESG